MPWIAEGAAEDMTKTIAKLREERQHLIDEVSLAKNYRDILREELEKRAKQLGVACLEHDLTHSLACGRCLAAAEKRAEAAEAREAKLSDVVEAAKVWRRCANDETEVALCNAIDALEGE